MAQRDRRNISQPLCYKVFNEEGRMHNSDSDHSEVIINAKSDVRNSLSLQHKINMATEGDNQASPALHMAEVHSKQH